jgi:hypothetical protein
MNDMNDNAANPVSSVKPIILSVARMLVSHSPKYAVRERFALAVKK